MKKAILGYVENFVGYLAWAIYYIFIAFLALIDAVTVGKMRLVCRVVRSVNRALDVTCRDYAEFMDEPCEK